MVKGRLNPVRAVLRFVASVMMVSGILLIVDAGLTLAWQEPISAFTANKEQNQLETALVEDPPKRVIDRKPLKGDAIARIRFPKQGESHFVVEGTDDATLRKGPGHNPKSPLPGERGTSHIAGHRTTFGAPFRHVDRLKPGDTIAIDMPDGTFSYRVERTKIVEPTDLSVLDKVSFDRLVLTACHPLHSAAQRIVVFAKFTRKSRSRVRT